MLALLIVAWGLSDVSAEEPNRQRKEGVSSLTPAGKEPPKVTTSKLPPEVRRPLAEIGAIVLERSARSGRLNSPTKQIPTGTSTLTPVPSPIAPKTVTEAHSPAPSSPQRKSATPKRVAEARKSKTARASANASPASATPAGAAPATPTVFADSRLGEVATSEQIDPKLAAQVAAVLSKYPPPAAKNAPGTPRIAVVRMPSEHWLLKTCEGLNELPANERVAAFRDILQRYKRMRNEERAASSSSIGG